MSFLQRTKTEGRRFSLTPTIDEPPPAAVPAESALPVIKPRCPDAVFTGCCPEHLYQVGDTRVVPETAVWRPCYVCGTPVQGFVLSVTCAPCSATLTERLAALDQRMVEQVTARFLARVGPDWHSPGERQAEMRAFLAGGVA